MVFGMAFGVRSMTDYAELKFGRGGGLVGRGWLVWIPIRFSFTLHYIETVGWITYLLVVRR